MTSNRETPQMNGEDRPGDPYSFWAGYPQGPGYAPLPRDFADISGYLPDSGYQEYPQAQDYPSDPGYPYETESRPPLEVPHDAGAYRGWTREDLLVPRQAEAESAWDSSVGLGTGGLPVRGSGRRSRVVTTGLPS